MPSALTASTRRPTPQMWVKRYHDAGFQQIKIYSSMKSDNVRAVCADAHQLGMTVTGHIPNGMTAYDGVNDGMDQINHIHYILDMLLPARVDLTKLKLAQPSENDGLARRQFQAGKKAVAFLKEHNTVIDPTMALMEFENRPANVPADKMEPGIDHVAPELRAQLVNGGLPPDLAADAQKLTQKELALIGALHRAGVRIIAGTDQTVPGYSLYRGARVVRASGLHSDGSAAGGNYHARSRHEG